MKCVLKKKQSPVKEPFNDAIEQALYCTVNVNGTLTSQPDLPSQPLAYGPKRAFTLSRRMRLIT